MKTIFLSVVFFVASIAAKAQTTFPYEVIVNPLAISEMPAIHSFAYAQHNGKWLFIGGRLDGLHALQPFNAFNAANSNTNIYVFDPTTDVVWSRSLASLSVPLQEQLQSSNMNFHQAGDTLYLIGGYGFSATANTHVTYDQLTTVDVPGLMQAVQSGTAIGAFFKQLSDPIFKNTGGQLNQIGAVFHLIGGHEFNGRYNPMGGPSYTQVYKTAIQRFTVNNAGAQLSFDNYSIQSDPVNLRRRDYNLIEQIGPNGNHWLTISAGVFQQQVNLPFLYPVEVSDTGFTPRPDFNQYLSHYHGPKISLYDAANNENHALFFGGMAQFFYDGADLIEDQGVPFVKTISRLTRNANGAYQEFNLPVEMPAFQTASAEFIPNKALPVVHGKVVDVNSISSDTVVLGHIVGGIFSPLPNAFNNNQTSQTTASASVFVVLLVNNATVSQQPVEGDNPFSSELFPNPFTEEIQVTVTLPTQGKVAYVITAIDGQTVAEGIFDHLSAGKRTVYIPVSRELSAGTYFVNLIFNDRFYSQHKAVKLN